MAQKEKEKPLLPHPNLIVCISLGRIGARALLYSLGTLLPNFRLHSIIYLPHQTPSNVQASHNAYGKPREKKMLMSVYGKFKKQQQSKQVACACTDVITVPASVINHFSFRDSHSDNKCQTMWVLQTGAHLKMVHAVLEWKSSSL